MASCLGSIQNTYFIILNVLTPVPKIKKMYVINKLYLDTEYSNMKYELKKDKPSQLEKYQINMQTIEKQASRMQLQCRFATLHKIANKYQSPFVLSVLSIAALIKCESLRISTKS